MRYAIFFLQVALKIKIPSKKTRQVAVSRRDLILA